MTTAQESFNDLVGIEVVHSGADGVTLRLAVTPRLHQPHGIVHGGVYCALIEAAASYAAAQWAADRFDVVGVSNHTDFLRAVREGTLRAVSAPIHRGRLQQLWQVEVRDDAGRLVSRGEVRLQNIESADRLGGPAR